MPNKYMRRLSVPLVAVALLVLAGAAIAANQKAGYTYTTATTAKYYVRLKVAKNAKRVTLLNLPTPVYCTEAAGGFGQAPTVSTSITKTGTFKVTVGLLAPGGGKIDESDTVTGTFLKGGAEKGTVSSNLGSGKVCHGIKIGYSTTGAASG
jgi:hypothetical protein